MKKNIKQNIVIILTLFVVMFGISLFRNCSSGKKAKSSPQTTLETFYRNLCAGEFEAARSLCTTLSMDAYIDGFRTQWENTDSVICTLASDILSEMAINVSSVEKNRDTRTVFYTLTTTDGLSKEKVATLTKEEREWKIAAITDKN